MHQYIIWFLLDSLISIKDNKPDLSRQGQAQELWSLVYGLVTSLDIVLFEHGKLPCNLSVTVYLDFGDFPDTQGYLGLLSEPCTPAWTHKKLAHKILVTAQRLNSPFPFWICLSWILGMGFGLGLGLGLVNSIF